MTVGEIDETLVPIPAAHLISVPVGGELVLIDGWSQAVVLSGGSAWLWQRFDGSASIGEIAGDLSREVEADRTVIAADAVALARELGASGLLAGVEPAEVTLLEGTPPRGLGDQLEDIATVDLDGTPAALSDFTGGEGTLLVYWNPHCGYCASIATRLATVATPLRKNGVTMVFLALGDTVANRALAEAAGLSAPMLLLPAGADPFPGAGTPSAFLLDADLRITEAAWGSTDVPALAAKIAGVDDVPADDDGPRYLLEADGLCPAVIDSSAPVWTGAAVHRIADHHVGFRYDTEATAELLDQLFGRRRVRDDRAGHSYSLRLGTSEPAAGGGVRPLHLLVRPDGPTVRSRHRSRVLRALLWDLHDKLAGPEAAAGRMRVSAVAGLHRSGMLLLPSAVHAFGQRLQPLLAQVGIAIADVPHPEVDLETLEVVLPQPLIEHDTALLEQGDGVPPRPSAEGVPVLPGRYPLIAWGALYPSDELLTIFSPAQAAAANLSSVLDSGDQAARVRQLGELFTQVRGFGYWYHSERQFADVISSVLE